MPDAGDAVFATAAVKAPSRETGRSLPAPPSGAPHVDEAELLACRLSFETALRTLVTATPFGSAGSRERRRYNAAVARLIKVARKLEDIGEAVLYKQASALVLLLGRTELDLDAALAVLTDLEHRCSRNWAIPAVMRGLRSFLLWLVIPTSAVLWFGAALIHVSVGKPLVTAIGAHLQSNANVLLCTGFGIVGAIVSMLTRMQEFAAAQRKSRNLLHYTGFCLPVVGGAFGFVTYALFTSGLVGFPVGDTAGPATPDAWQFYVVIGFLSGFSERFTRGLLDGTAGVLTKSMGGKEGEPRRPERPGKGEPRHP